ncbi:hypothetical protein GUITHDRAFT_114343 [Guillardia theta CCMP2712]|uniref:Pru domain-containing protein n=1 Tax=Guillardia theta (strain CCMP2712) TaxID=905079 RepID=L1IUN6_GUITC|nr:hypothetical protein GUITHDRAFT_114343 [Guillardia theta CCMP2712]EKX39614.1 hypothetical protein GUITHDRAFT_114343 [Guillardia theta CCMP2712]|eukprot:XP_005826594.1 hypothetical protein GUITHDRAFT_114343 [Guillardia theta CCMP2712]
MPANELMRLLCLCIIAQGCSTMGRRCCTVRSQGGQRGMGTFLRHGAGKKVKGILALRGGKEYSDFSESFQSSLEERIDPHELDQLLTDHLLFIDEDKAETVAMREGVQKEKNKEEEIPVLPSDEFKAGKMEEEGGVLRPLTERGLLTIEQHEDDGMWHLHWTSRVPNRASVGKLDILLLSGDGWIERLMDWKGEPVTGARIYRVGLNSTGRVYYFWMQEASIEVDDVLFNRVDHILNPPTYNESLEGFGWRWTSHLNISLSQGLHKALVGVRDANLELPNVPAAHDEQWRRVSEVQSHKYRQHWIVYNRMHPPQQAQDKVATPRLIPMGGKHPRFWEKDGATRITHWDPISITCPTPGAEIYYTFWPSIDYYWNVEDADETPCELSWEKYQGPFSLPLPYFFEEKGYEDWRVKAVAVKEGMTRSDVVAGEFAVVTHKEDLPKVRYDVHMRLRHVLENSSHPLFIEYDMRIRRACYARKKHWEAQLEKHASGEINEFTEQQEKQKHRQKQE